MINKRYMRFHSRSATMHLLCRATFVITLAGLFSQTGCSSSKQANTANKEDSIYRQRISINDGWKFMRYTGEADSLVYEKRPAINRRDDNIVADTRASDSALGISSGNVLKKWILP